METQDHKKLHLILIEDNDFDAYLIGEAARQLSYELNIRRFSTAPAAMLQLEDAVEHNPDGVLLDLNLPGGSGLDVLRKIRSSERCQGLKVVVMTSSMSTKDREAAERIGIEGYLVKASDYDVFVSTLGQALNSLGGLTGRS
jgi:DNA-binding NarL/FixJ family response regulator